MGCSVIIAAHSAFSGCGAPGSLMKRNQCLGSMLLPTLIEDRPFAEVVVCAGSPSRPSRLAAGFQGLDGPAKEARSGWTRKKTG